jgi:hypothetical protein
LAQRYRRLKRHDQSHQKAHQRHNRQRIDSRGFRYGQGIAPAHGSGTEKCTGQADAEFTDETDERLNVAPDFDGVVAELFGDPFARRDTLGFEGKI